MIPLSISLNPIGREIIPQIIPTAVVTLNRYNGSFKKPANDNVKINERNPSTKRTHFIGFSLRVSMIFCSIIVSIKHILSLFLLLTL